GHWLTGSVDLSMLLSLISGSVPAIVVGSYLAPHLPVVGLRYFLALVLAVAGGRLVASQGCRFGCFAPSCGIDRLAHMDRDAALEGLLAVDCIAVPSIEIDIPGEPGIGIEPERAEAQ